jgi:hypothetical protein
LSRLKSNTLWAVPLVFAATFAVGCQESTEVPLKTVPAVQAPPPQPAPVDQEKTPGGRGSSGAMTKNPGADS